jgi:hypothetical protein
MIDGAGKAWRSFPGRNPPPPVLGLDRMPLPASARRESNLGEQMANTIGQGRKA